MINRVILIGNLGKDPDIRRLDNGVMVAKFSLATNENYKDKVGEWQQLTEWHDIVAWRGLAERAEQSLKKGSMIYLEGKLTHRTWQADDGSNRRTTEVVANYFRVLTGKKETPNYFPTEEPPDLQRETAPAATGDGGGDAAQADDDLPF